MAKESARSMHGLLVALSALDIGNPNSIKRVVIDMDFSSGNPPVLYVEHYGDAKVLDVIQAITSADIIRE